MTGNMLKFVWKGILFNTMEILLLHDTDTGYTGEGTITGDTNGKPANITYRIELDKNWMVKSVSVTDHIDNGFYVQLNRNPSGKWFNAEGSYLPEFDGCEDIDIALTPFTNTLSINRLLLKSGDSGETNVVYIDPLNGDLKKVKQQYTNLGDGSYRYENLISGFSSVISTDDKGVVTDYPGIWTRTYPQDTPGVPEKVKSDFVSALLSNTLSAEIPVKDDLYGCLIGRWDVMAYDRQSDGSTCQVHGEWIFARVLEGRAIQDIWIAPLRAERTSQMSRQGNRYGTSLRMYNPNDKQWTSYWINPVSGAFDKLQTRKAGKDIVQEGKDEEGYPMRWIFTDITDDSFRWYAEHTLDGGNSWKVEAEFLGKRKQ